ncbi:MAG: hypothetical protein NC541_06105 [bacterium]|nr:hypothetical protein [bacterium]MCM1499438.1 hypothetical protein [Clostridium sp.]
MKRAYIIYIVCFVAILLLPLVFYPLVAHRLDHNNYENRALMSFEELSESDWKTFFPDLELLIKDNMPYKNECINLINRVDEYIFHDLFNQSVMVGKENWLFYKGNDCIQDYRGGYVLSDRELQAYAAAADSLKKSLEDRGIDFYIMITPNKEAIYGDDYLPDRVKRYSTESRADQIVSYLSENTDVPIIYPKQSLQAAASDYQVWRKYDTHWNNVGAFIASQELLKELGLESVWLSDVAIMKDGTCGGDLAGMLGMSARYSDDTVYVIDGYYAQVSVENTESVPQPNLSYSKFESDAVNEVTVLCIGDSFLGSMEQYLSKNFKKAMFVHRDNYTSLERDLIVEESPDIVVMQIAERFLTYFDDSMLRYARMYSQE